MASPLLTIKEVKSAVTKDSTERLIDELHVCFPSSTVSNLSTYNREELISKVVECRWFLKQSTRCQDVLEGKLEIDVSGKVGVGTKVEKVSEVSQAGLGGVATGGMEAVIMLIQMMEKRDRERDERDRLRREAEQIVAKAEQDAERKRL